MTTKTTILAVLPCTIGKMVEASGCARTAINASLGRLKAEKAIHIESWVRGANGQAMAVYALGHAPDAPYVRMGMSKAAWMRRKRQSLRQVQAQPEVITFTVESTTSYAIRSQPALARVWA